MSARSEEGSMGIADFLEKDPFRLTRSDADLRRIERESFERSCVSEAVSFSCDVTAIQSSDTPDRAIDRADAYMYRQKRRRKRERID